MASIEIGSSSLFSDPNLVAYYKYSNGAVTTDSSGNGNTLTNSNVTSVSGGKFDYGASYASASNSYSDTGVNLVGQDKAISMWFDSSTANDTSAILFGSQGATDNNRFYFGYDNSGNLGIGLGSSGYANESGGYQLDTNFHHYVFMYDYSATTAYLYVDGSLIAQKTNATADSSRDYYIGANNYHGGLGQVVNGVADDVGIFSRLLTVSEINEIYYGPTNLGLALMGVGR